MPLQRCSSNGKSGWKYGDSGSCYTYTEGDDASEKRAKKKAVRQALAIGGGKAPSDLSERDLAEAGVKTCSQCQMSQPLKRFPPDGRTSDGHSNMCVSCRFEGYAEREFALKTTDKAWDGSAGRFTDDQYKRSCLINRADPDKSVKQNCSLPVLEPDGTLNVNALSSALGRIDQLNDVSTDDKAKAKRKLASLYQQAGLDVPDKLKNLNDRYLAELETVDLDGVPILSAGGPYFGDGSPEEGDTFDDKYLETLATNNELLKSEVKVPIKVGHSRGQRLLKNSGLWSDEQPAAGWLENFRVAGGNLLADLKKVPQKIADLIESKAFRTRSVELSKVRAQTDSGKEYEVVTGLALLGAKAPAVRTLDDIITGWYADDDDRHMERTISLLLADVRNDTGARTVDFAEGDVIWDAENGANDWSADLAAALNENVTMTSPNDIAAPYYVQDLDQLNRRAIVCDWRSNQYWVVPFSVGGGADPDDPVPAPFEQWTLAEQAWVQADDANDGSVPPGNDYAERGKSGQAGDTTSVGNGATATELSDEQIASFAETLGIDESDAAKRREQVMAKFADLTKEQTPPTPPTPPTPTPPEPPAPTEPAPPSVSLSQEEKDKLFADAEASRAFIAAQQKSRVEANLMAAAKMGKIAPADFDGWRSFMEREYDLAVEALAKLPVNVQLLSTYGDDGTGEEAHNRDEELYRTYAAQTGVTVPDRSAA